MTIELKDSIIETIALEDLSDVSITSVADNDLLQYNSGTGEWENVAVSAIACPGNDTEVIFNDGGVFGGNSGFTYDKTNEKVGISTAVAAFEDAKLHITKSQGFSEASIIFKDGVNTEGGFGRYTFGHVNDGTIIATNLNFTSTDVGVTGRDDATRDAWGYTLDNRTASSQFRINFFDGTDKYPLAVNALGMKIGMTTTFNPAHPLEIYNPANTLLMTVQADTNVGIGAITPTQKLQVNGNIWVDKDNNKIVFGTGLDCSITYDGTNMVINPKNVGSGYVDMQGNLVVTGTVTSDGLILGDNETIGWGGDESLTFDGTQFTLSESLDVSGNIAVADASIIPNQGITSLISTATQAVGGSFTAKGSGVNVGVAGDANTSGTLNYGGFFTASGGSVNNYGVYVNGTTADINMENGSFYTTNDFDFNDDVNVTGILAATTVTGANVTSGADPGHTHTSASITAPGATTQVIFNDGGALGADAGMVYDKTNDKLTLSQGSYSTILNNTATGVLGYFSDGTIITNINNPSDATSIATNRGIFVDGGADQNQLRLQAHSTQTNDVIDVEDSSGVTQFAVSGVGHIGLKGTAPSSLRAVGLIDLTQDAGLQGYYTQLTASGNSRVITAVNNILSSGTGNGSLITGTNGVMTGFTGTGNTIIANQYTISTNVASNTAYGDKITLQASTDPTVNQIGYHFFTTVDTSDTNMKKWAWYNDGAGNNGSKMFMGKDNVKTYWGTGFDSSVYYDGTDLVINSAEVGTGSLKTSQGRIHKTSRETGSTTLDTTDEIVFVDTDGGAITITLPAGVEGTHYRITNCGTSGNDVTVDGDGAETVMGALTQALSDGETINIYYNGTEGWW